MVQLGENKGSKSLPMEAVVRQWGAEKHSQRISWMVEPTGLVRAVEDGGRPWRRRRFAVGPGFLTVRPQRPEAQRLGGSSNLGSDDTVRGSQAFQHT